MPGFSVTAIIFFGTLALTFAVALFARFRAPTGGPDEDLAGRKLNRWVIGISAGTTGNSGFVVTGAVGLGYAGGVHWLLFPLSWFLGDLVYWSLFPRRLNQLAREARATTISEMLTFDLSGGFSRAISVAVSLVLIVFLATYTAAQWLAGRKFLSGVFELSDIYALVVFGATIVAYSSIAGFRGSVYTDVVQGVIRIIGTVVALGAVIWFAFADLPTFSRNISAAGDNFLMVFPNATVVLVLGFVVGYACAAIGFGLGQPQIVSRYLAGRSPEETRSAMWVYISFVQGTWIAMTIFGILLRGVMPNIADPETGLSLFFQRNIGAVATGIIFADVFATIAATANGILVAISQTLLRDLLGIKGKSSGNRWLMTGCTLALGLVTIVLSLSLPGNVFSIAISAASEIAAGLAGAVLIKVLRWRHSALSLFISIVSGISAAIIWKALGYDAILNEAGVGMAASILANWLVSRIAVRRVVTAGN